MTTPVFQSVDEAFVYCRDMDESLRVRLETFSAAARRLRPAMQEATDRMVERLMATEAGAAAPKVGERMPPFVLPDERGELVSLEALCKVGPVAVTFHRGHWCPYCRISTRALAEVQAKVAADGGQIVAIMPDRHQFAAAFKGEAEASYPVLTDMDNGYALSLNLAIWVGAEVQGSDGEFGPRSAALSRQRRLAIAASGELRCRSVPASSGRGSSTPTIAGGWRSRISSRPCGAPGNPARSLDSGRFSDARQDDAKVIWTSDREHLTLRL